MADIIMDEPSDDPNRGWIVPVGTPSYSAFPNEAVPMSDLHPPVETGFRAVELLKRSILDSASSIEEINLALQLSRIAKHNGHSAGMVIAWTQSLCNLMNILTYAASLESDKPDFFKTPEEIASSKESAVAVAARKADSLPSVRKVLRKKKED